MEATGILGIIYRDHGKENGNFRDYRDYVGLILGLCRDDIEVI